jgi:hypothetical protein
MNSKIDKSMMCMERIVLITFLCLVFTACNNKKRVSETEHLLNEWIGKTVLFTDIEPVYINQHITDSVRKQYRILLYMDSIGCMSCKFHIDVWKSHINEIGNKVDFLFYFNSNDENKLLFWAKRFDGFIYIDKNDELNKLNHFPSNPMFQCFLLDKDDNVLAIGNPATNPKIWELYKKIITGKISDKPPVTVVEPEQTEIELKDLQAGKTSEAIFVLKNTGTHPLIIQQVESSCGCTVPEWDKQPVATGKSAKIKVRITPEKSEYFNKTVTVHCNTEKGRVSFIIKGTVK